MIPDDCSADRRSDQAARPACGLALAGLLIACVPVVMAWTHMDKWSLWALAGPFCQ